VPGGNKKAANFCVRGLTSLSTKLIG